ncbi:MAG: PilN domain-containing protein [Pseudohongiella sp.]|uniref:PilN domain-containing protein n=1 Tax=Pseudohongiella sp. TaxID=1979412 RepID=UPI00349FD564
MRVSTLMTINLLPWREARQLRRRQWFWAGLAAAALLAVVAVATAALIAQSVISGRERHNSGMAAQLDALQQRVSEQDALFEAYQRQDAEWAGTRRLHSARLRQTRTLVALLANEPEGLTLDRLRYAPPAIVVEGAAESAGRVSQWMMLLGNHPYIDNPELQALRVEDISSGGRPIYFYRVRFELPVSGAAFADTAFMVTEPDD